MCAHQGIGNVSFSEYFAYVLNELSLIGLIDSDDVVHSLHVHFFLYNVIMCIVCFFKVHNYVVYGQLVPKPPFIPQTSSLFSQSGSHLFRCVFEQKGQDRPL